MHEQRDFVETAGSGSLGEETLPPASKIQEGGGRTFAFSREGCADSFEASYSFNERCLWQPDLRL